jgi:hypothetical protein
MSTKKRTDQETAQEAYRLWEAEGRPEGRDVAHWHQAERGVAEPVIEPIEGGPDEGTAASSAPPQAETQAADEPIGGSVGEALAGPLATPAKPKATRARKPKAAEDEPAAPKAPRRRKSPDSKA